MSSLSVAAVVVSHSAPGYLEKTLEGLADQTLKPQQIVVVDTAGDPESQQLVQQRGLALVQPGDVRLGAAITAGIASLQQKPNWLWILHEDSAPEPMALERLSVAAEISPSVAVIGPKLLRWEKPIEIQQMGLTLTQTGRPFLLVEHEYDQGQHDNTGDTLAVSTAGMLVSTPLWEKLGGIDDSTPVFAHDLEFCMRARAAGFRVVLEASARVHHAGLAMESKRSRSWLGGGRRTALARAHLHLATQLMPAWLLPLAYLALPIAWLALIPKHLLTKRPSRIFGQLAGWVWAWATVPKRLAARKKTRSFGSLAGQRALFASRAQIRRRRSLRYEYEPIGAADETKGIFASGAAWLGLVPLALGITRLPSDAIAASHLSPIGRSFEAIWSQTAVGTLSFLDGVSLPSEPGNWFFALLGLVNPDYPSLALSWFVFIAPALAFYAAWAAIGQVTTKAWVRNSTALVFSLSPQVLALQSNAAAAELLALVLMPLIFFMLLRTARVFSRARAWRWASLAGLLAALLATVSPIGLLATALMVIAIGVTRPRRLAILPWALVPGLVILSTWVLAAVQIDPLLALSSVSWRVGSYEPDQIALILLAALAALSLFAFSSRPVLALLSGSSAGAFFYLAEISSGALFAEGHALALLALLFAVAAAMSALSKKLPAIVAATSMFVVSLASGYLGLIQTPVNYLNVDDRLAPALVVALSDVDPEVRTLLIRAGSEIEVDFVWGDGRSQEEKNQLYEARLGSSAISGQLAQLAGSLVAGNPEGVGELLDATSVDFVLIEKSSERYQEAVVAISSLTAFQASGESEYGALFRVVESSAGQVVDLEANSARNLQLGLLTAYLLIAIPTPATIRGYRRRAVES